MKARMIKAECIQAGDRLARENCFGEQYSLLVSEVDHGDYMSIHYITEEGCEMVTHHFSDEIILIEDDRV